MLNQKVLTIYGDREWNSEDPAYCKNAMIRGYAGLNAGVHKLIQSNQDITVHSVSHSSIFYPDPDGYGDMLRIFATIVYSGDIKTLPSIFEKDRGEDDALTDTGLGYGTMLLVDAL